MLSYPLYCLPINSRAYPLNCKKALSVGYPLIITGSLDRILPDTWVGFELCCHIYSASRNVCRHRLEQLEAAQEFDWDHLSHLAPPGRWRNLLERTNLIADDFVIIISLGQLSVQTQDFSRECTGNVGQPDILTWAGTIPIPEDGMECSTHELFACVDQFSPSCWEKIGWVSFLGIRLSYAVQLHGKIDAQSVCHDRSKFRRLWCDKVSEVKDWVGRLLWWPWTTHVTTGG